MPLNLHITFGGMCLLVRDYQQEQLSVLLPAVPHAEKPHTATLHFKLGSQVHSVAMVRHLNLTRLPTHEELSLDFPQRLVDLDYVTGEAISRELLTGPNSNRVSSLVTLKAGYCRGVSKGARWHLGSRPPRFMATTVEWVIGNIDPEALPLFSEYSEPSVREWENTVRSQGDGTIHIGIFNTPDDDKPISLPPTETPDDDLEAGLEVHHFGAFYHLYDTPMESPLPVFKDTGRQPGSKMKALNQIMGVTYTCIAATATAEE
jgi:hypothetical protein